MMRTMFSKMASFAGPRTGAQSAVRAEGSAASFLRLKSGLAAAVAALLLAACGGDALWAINNDCDEELAATVRELGQPDSISKVAGWDTDTVIYVYRSIGLIRSFEWGPYRDCKGKDEYFTPR